MASWQSASFATTSHTLTYKEAVYALLNYCSQPEHLHVHDG